MHPALEEHLSSRNVSRVIYGAVVGLALILALEDHPPATGETIGLLVGTAVAVGLAEFYSEIVGEEARTRRPIHAARIRRLAGDALWVAFGVGFPAVFFVLAAAGVMQTPTAFRLAKWTGLGLICGYGYLAARLSGAGQPKAIAQAILVGTVGAALIVLKSLTH